MEECHGWCWAECQVTQDAENNLDIVLVPLLAVWQHPVISTQQ